MTQIRRTREIAKSRDLQEFLDRLEARINRASRNS
jgi:hypothetical protein